MATSPGPVLDKGKARAPFVPEQLAPPSASTYNGRPPPTVSGGVSSDPSQGSASRPTNRQRLGDIQIETRLTGVDTLDEPVTKTIVRHRLLYTCRETDHSHRDGICFQYTRSSFKSCILEDPKGEKFYGQYFLYHMPHFIIIDERFNVQRLGPLGTVPLMPLPRRHVKHSCTPTLVLPTLDNS